MMFNGPIYEKRREREKKTRKHIPVHPLRTQKNQCEWQRIYVFYKPPMK